MLPYLMALLAGVSPGAGFAIVAVTVGGPLLFRSLRRPKQENPTVAGIESQHRATGAEQNARVAQELARQTQERADTGSDQARIRQEEAERAAAHVAEEIAQMRARMEESRHARELAEEGVTAAREDAARFAQEAQGERERARQIREDAERAITAAREEAERALRVAEEQRREAEASKILAEEMARTAAEEVRKAMEAKEDAERRLKEGIQPVVMPSPEELAATKKRVQYKEDCFHCAVAGISGSGKSSLVNAFCGVRGEDAGAAAVGVIETTLEVTRYADANLESPFVWYDVPGAGTLKCRDWQYFNDQGLYIFDCIIVLFDNRFTMTDVAVLMNARRFKIPTYIVRSKADQHIRNIMIQKGYDSDADDEDATQRRDRLYTAARKQFIEDTRRSVRANLEDANLPDQRVYIVSSITMLSIVVNKMPKKTIDELDLLNDLVNHAYARRLIKPDDVDSTGLDSGTGR